MQINFAPRVLARLRGEENLFADDIAVREQAIAASRASKDTRIRPVVPTARQISRQRHRDMLAMGRKSRRSAFKQAQVRERQEQLLQTWARVYLEGHGNDDVRCNVTEAVHRQAEEYSKAHGEPFTTSLKRLEGELINANLRSAARKWGIS